MAGNKEETRLLRGMEYFQSTFRNSSLQIRERVGHGIPLAQSELFNASLNKAVLAARDHELYGRDLRRAATLRRAARALPFKVGLLLDEHHSRGRQGLGRHVVRGT